ncbi:hypothetical protein NC651_005917 [Populus alba x Populus x berolinensis]|nr:hypothetical protein NC651_005917 [Populus alba x Populus x berolinensis]
MANHVRSIENQRTQYERGLFRPKTPMVKISNHTFLPIGCCSGAFSKARLKLYMLQEITT